MYNVNILGKNMFAFSNNFTSFNYDSTENFDFDLFVTDGFHLVQSGRSEPILNYEDLKTDKLVIFNYDKCNPVEKELFTSIREFLKDKNIKCLVLSLHHIVNQKDLPTDFDYLSFDFFVFESVNSYSDWKDTFDIFTDTIHYLRPKKFLSFNNIPHPHRIELKKFLTRTNYIDDGWFTFESESENGINIDCISGYGPNHFSRINLGLYLTSYFSILTETLFSGDDIPTIKLTNKVFMTMKGFHPFFMMGQPKTLNYLKQCGFKTFGDFWDEKYDDEFRHDKRMSKIFTSLKSVLGGNRESVHRKMFGKNWNGSANEGEWTKLFNILKHNYLHLPIHAENQKQKVINKINNFLGTD
tara:strand:+ start:13 stop:1077 length:1065 start_codon:yes stop_codon:yes gene_type:complete